jgi:putative endonuclease
LRSFGKEGVAGGIKASHVAQIQLYRCGVPTMAAFVYIMSNRRNGIRYAGVTTNLPKRSFEHREGLVDGFTRRYGLKMLVYYEVFDDVCNAIQREKTMKHWPRAWKVRLIDGMNPDWKDLYETLF